MATIREGIESRLRIITLNNEVNAGLMEEIQRIQSECNHPVTGWQKVEDLKYGGSQYTFPIKCQDCLKVVQVDKSVVCSKCLEKMLLIEEIDTSDGETEKTYRCFGCGRKYKKIVRE